MKVTRLDALREAIFGVPTPVDIKEGTVIIGSVPQTYGVRLPTDFRTQVTIYNSDPCVKESIINMAEQVSAGGGFFVTTNDSYITKFNGMNARETINYFNETNDLDKVLLLASKELVAFGNSIWYIKDGLKHCSIELIDHAIARKKTIPIQSEYNLITTYDAGNKTIHYGEFIHMKNNVIGFEPFGTGIILGLIVQPDNDTPSLWTMRKSVRMSMDEGFRKFSFGNELWTIEGLSPEDAKIIGKKIANMSSTGNRILATLKGDIKLAVPQRTQSYDKWIEQIDKEFYLALSSGMSPNTEYTTKATAEAVAEFYEKKIFALRRVLKRNIEALWKKILTEAGFDPAKAKARLHFGSEEIQFETADVFTAATTIMEDGKPLISREEARDMLRENMKWKLEDTKGENSKDSQPIKKPEKVKEG